MMLLFSSTLSLFAQDESLSDHSLWNQLVQKHVDSDGWVDYKGFQEDSVLLHSYLYQLSQSWPDDTAEKEVRLAYYINLYNAYTVALVLREYPIESIKDIKTPWSEKFIPIGNQMLSLNDIEHGILRNLGEPRIHFAINCASISCPKLLNEAYLAETLEAQLTKVTKSFINGPENDLKSQPIHLSKIFKWYRGDFTVNGKRDLIGYINQFSKSRIPTDIKIDFGEYNWQLNEK